MIVTWCIVPEIWNTIVRIFGHFGPFFAFLPPDNLKNQNFEKMKTMPGYIIILHMCTTNDNHMTDGSWDKKCDRQNFLSFWTVFLLFLPPNNPKNHNFEKRRKTPGDITILHMCTINDTHVMYGSWDIESNGQTFLSFLTIFHPFNAPPSPQQPEKSKFWKNRKNTWRYYHVTHVYDEWQSYDAWFLRHGAWQIIFCHFGPFFALLSP